MRIGAIVQARMSSSRLPGKILTPVGGKPMLVWLLESLALCGDLDTVILATSVEPSDDPVEMFCNENGYTCFRGPLDDVAGRFVRCSETHGLDAFVRICGDSPLLDHGLVDRGVGIFRHEKAELVTNVLPRTFPKGQSVEVVSAESYAHAYGEMSTSEEREHVTKRYYANPDQYRIKSFESGGEFGDIQLSVDTAEDMDRFRSIVRLMDRPHWEYGWHDLLELARHI